VDRANLAGRIILVVEEQALVALDLRTALEQAGAEVMVARNATEALAHINKFDFAAAVIDWRPDSDDHRVVARALKQEQVRFLFYATHPPEDVVTIGELIVAKNLQLHFILHLHCCAKRFNQMDRTCALRRLTDCAC
jgi:CheY-like chemotaxis protein